MVAFPQSNLPPKSQPWGRGIENTVASNISNVRSAAVATNNNLKQINSSINLLQRQQDTLAQNQASLATQQAYLNSFVSYLSENNTSQSTSLYSQWVNVSSLSVTFTLYRTASVLIKAYSEVSSSSSRTTAGQAGVTWRCSLVNGVNTYESLVGSQLKVIGSVDTSSTMYDISENSRILRLAAGTYTFTSNWSVYNYGTSGSASTNRKILTATIIG